MEEVPAQATCPVCHVAVRPTDYFCYNCGRNLHPALPSLTMATLIPLFLGTIFLPPMGIIWGFRYVKQEGMQYKTVGFAMMVITVIILIVAVRATFTIVNTATSQMNSQLENIGGF